MIRISSGDIFHVSIATSHRGLSVSSLPLEIELLVPLNAVTLENHYQKHQNQFEKLIDQPGKKINSNKLDALGLRYHEPK